MSHLPTLITRSIECELFLDPAVDLVQRHLLLRGGHRQADQGCVGVGGLGFLVHRKLVVLENLIFNYQSKQIAPPYW